MSTYASFVPQTLVVAWEIPCIVACMGHELDWQGTPGVTEERTKEGKIRAAFP